MNSSDELTAPLEYQISSSCEDHSKIITIDCPLCLKASSHFYCKTCLKDGDFFHSNGKSCESYGDKKIRLLKLQQEKSVTEKLCEKKLEPRVKLVSILGAIEEIKERNKFLRFLVDEKKTSIGDMKNSVSKLKEAISVKVVKLRRYEERVGKLRFFVSGKLTDLNTLAKSLNCNQDELKKIRCHHIKQLVSYIFPISPIEPAGKREHLRAANSPEDTSRAALEQGKCVFRNKFTERHLRIVAPSLPASGDYSAYNDWVAANKDCVPSTSANTNVDFNPAYNISAALTYTTQLVNMLAYYLDVRLPAKLCYSDFCSNELPKGKFLKKVARLNWNILHLCLSQNVDPKFIKPECTLSNILLLLDQTISDLGRSLTPDANPEESRVLEDALRPFLEVEDPEDSGDEGLSYEWEAVPSSSGLPESEPMQNAQASQVSSVSVAGGLLTSTAASLVSLLRWNR